MAPTLVVVGQLLLAQNATLGARLSASCMLVGPSWVGAVFAGIVGTIARTVENKAAYIVLLCILTIIAFAILSGPRAARAPHFIGYGILLSLVFVIPLVVGEFQYGRSIGEYWKNPVWDSIRSSMLAAGCVLVSGVLVFPSLAGSELQCTTAHVLRNVGRCMSRCVVCDVCGFWHGVYYVVCSMRKHMWGLYCTVYCVVTVQERPHSFYYYHYYPNATMSIPMYAPLT